ncbi:MAG: phosphatase PAP2 family protein [Streptococcaceae bacterium]|jgi:undecaprenyl-diphosphatase|nr:phosphatase PAP2 family protein [Streptococcaceae bacterium]
MKNRTIYQLIGSFCLVAFVILGYVVKFYPKMLIPFDTTVQDSIRQGTPNHLTSFFKLVTQFGNFTPMMFSTLIVIALLLIGKERIAALWLAIGMIAIPLTAVKLLKLVYQRQRPPLLHLVQENSLSFPSGHATVALVFLGTLLLIFGQILKSNSWKILLTLFSGLIVLLIGISRIYLGVHYPTDVLAGFLLAGGWLFLTYPIFVKMRVASVFKSIGRV